MDRDNDLVIAIVTGLEVYQKSLLRGMRSVFTEAGLSLLAFVNLERSTEDSNVDAGSAILPELACLLAHHRPRGVILTNPISSEQATALREVLGSSGIPTVYVAQDVPGRTCVRSDNMAGMRALMAHLLDECDVKVAAMIRGYAHQVDHVEREQVFREELARRGLEVSEELLVDGHAEREGARNGVRRILAKRRDIEAVVTTDDWCANAVIEVLAESGLRVPEDVVVTGFDNYPIATLSWPGVTSVDQNLEIQGAVTARTLLQLALESSSSQTVLTSCTLVARKSTLNSFRASRQRTADANVATDDEPTLATMAELAQTQIAGYNAVRRASRALSDCRSLDAVCDALESCLPLLGVRRCFLVIYTDDPTKIGEPIPHRTAKLILDYRYGQSHDVQEPIFSNCSLLPEYLADELYQGYLNLQLLTMDGKTLGYLLTEDSMIHVAAAEVLRRDLGQILDSIFATNALRTHSEMLEQLVKRRTAELESEISVRKRAEQELRHALATDALTQIANRRAFNEYLAEQWRSHAGTSKLALLRIDVDFFKDYNVHYGQLEGDQALRQFAICLGHALRYPEDMSCRFGGDEFTVLLPKTDEEGAVIVAQRFQDLLKQAAIPHTTSETAPLMTASIGVAALIPTLTMRPDVLLAIADRAVYAAKQQGRNRVVVAPTNDT